jgi:hypothetical protein
MGVGISLHIEEDHLKKIAMNMKKKQENSKHQMTTNNNIPQKKTRTNN